MEMSSKNKKTVTAQGSSDTPVPVGGALAQGATDRHPDTGAAVTRVKNKDRDAEVISTEILSDCKEIEKIGQKVSEDPKTAEVAAFTRSSKTLRSPETQAREQAEADGNNEPLGMETERPITVPSEEEQPSTVETKRAPATLTQHESTHQESQREGVKRKELSPIVDPKNPTNPDMEDTVEAANKINGIVEDLLKLINDHPNTKVQIKKLIREQRMAMRKLMGGIARWKESTGDIRPEKKLCAQQVSHIWESEYLELPSTRFMKNVETQTIPILEGKELSEAERAVQFRKDILAAETNAQYFDLLTRDWPDSAFAKTTKDKTGILKAPKDWDKLIILAPDDNLKEGFGKKIRDRYPELFEEETPWPKYEYLSCSTRKSGSYSFIETCVHRTIIEEDKTDMLGAIERNRKTLGSFRRKILQRGKKNIVATQVSPNDEDKLRKFLEIVFAADDIEIKIFCKEISRPAYGRELSTKSATGERSTNKRTTEAVIIKTEGSSYAELLKKVRTNVNTKELGIDVKTIRKTNAGDIVVTVKEGQGQKLFESIRESNKDLKISHRKAKRRKLKLLDLDMATSEQEVRKAVERAVGKLQEDKCKIQIVQSRENDQMAILEVDETTAETLLRAKRIPVGWLQCRIREKIIIPKCFRCWSYEHNAAACNGTDRTVACLKCGQNGHKVETCNNQPYCPGCEEQGHRHGTIKCPKYKLAVQKLKEASKSTTTTDKSARV